MAAEDSGDETHDEGHVFVFDRRKEDGRSVKISLGGLFDYEMFRSKVMESFGLNQNERFVIVTTSRLEIVDNHTYEEQVESGDTLYVLKEAKQDLAAPVQEHIEYLPHYDTLVKSGMYEYYASAGQSPLPFAFAELIDNALAATAGNEGPRNIEVSFYFDDANSENTICVFDNGSGMTSKDLNNWAIYRLSKFNKHLKAGKTAQMRETWRDAPRSLNSDISYFGVGGKQAIFFIGSSTRVITKTKDSNDTHELSMSKGDFERKEKMKEAIYSGYIHNRRVGDPSHIPANNKIFQQIVTSEHKTKSFTNVVITGIENKQVKFLKQNFKSLCQQLAHIYHYYLHGPMGNMPKKSKGVRVASPFRNIDIQVALHEKGNLTEHVSLRDVNDDLESQLLQSTASIFEFDAQVEGIGVVEGVLRYHPFMYDKETFPDLSAAEFAGEIDQNANDLEEDSTPKDGRGPRGDKPIFECYWNGRLIPYTMVECLDWCAPPKKKKTLVPPECYYRISGVLFTNDSFQVSTNKLTFMDLEVKLKERSTIFNKIVMGQEQRVNIGRAFNEWVKQCHETCDKQIKFFGYSGNTKRSESGQKKSQRLWSVYKGVEWDGKIFKTGQLIRTVRTVPIIVGKVQKFLLSGEHDGDEVFATGGQMEITQEPLSIYGETKVLPLVKLDRNTTISALKEFIQVEELKLPSLLIIDWPEGSEVEENDKIPAGTAVGPLKVDIQNGKGESVSKIPGERMKKLLVEMKVIWHSEQEGDQTIVQHTCQHGGRSWPYWFHKMENITNIGNHTLKLRTIVSDTSGSSQLKSLPSINIRFVVTEAGASKFTVGLLETPLRIGMPFQIPLTLQDKFGNIVKPSKDHSEPTLTANGMEFTSSGTCIRGTLLVIRDVVAMGLIPSTGGKDFNMKITFSSLKEKSQSIKIRLLPGPPCTIDATPESLQIENGGNVTFNVEVQDKAGNYTSQPRLNVVCKMHGVPNLPQITCDCSSTGKGLLVSPSINLKQLKGQQKIVARIDLQHHKDVKSIDREITVTPSSRPERFEVLYLPPGSKQKKKMQDGQEIRCSAGAVLQGLSFKLFDEGNREMTIDNALATKIKVNWIGKVNKEEIKQGNLPDVKAPLSVDEVKYCQVSCNAAGSSLELVFNIRATHSQPTTMKPSCSDIKFRLNEPLSSDIRVMVSDDYGNSIKVDSKDLPGLSVTGDDLKESIVTKSISAGCFVIRNIQFEMGLPGPREICMSWKGCTCYQRLEMQAGPAVDLILVDIDNVEPLNLLNGNPFPKPLTIQLIDAAGNLSKEKNVRCMLARDPGLKLTPPPPQQRTDDRGQATFNHFSVSAARGLYQIVPKAMLVSGTKEGPIILVSVEPDRNKPVKMITKYDETSVLTAGGKLPVFEVCVLAEDQNPISNIKKKDLVMKIWRITSAKSSDHPPANATTLIASSGGLNDPEHHFYFRDFTCPETAGQHGIVIQYQDKGTMKLSSKKIIIDVRPADPVKLVPLGIPPTPTVSNNNRAANRYLVKNIQFQLQDKYGNTTGSDMNGMLKVNVESGGKKEIPCLQNGLTGAAFELNHGTSLIESLMVQADTKGIDGQEYVLSFSAEPVGTNASKIEPFKLSFLFYDDVQKQAKMAEQTKQRDQLTESIRTYLKLFEAMSQLIREMQGAVQEAAIQVAGIRNDLKGKNFKNAHSLTTNKLEKLRLSSKGSKSLNRHQKKRDATTALAAVKSTIHNIETQPRRKCRLPVGPRDKNILGKVAHLAQVREDDVARVLSWHLASDMDCIVTLTTEQAKQVYRETNGRQQVLPLDSIYKKGLPDWKRPLPHVRFPAIKLPGPAIYARDLLVFPAHLENCKTVFGMLLGDTIITDTLDTANIYRQEVVKYTYCPTILTRSGDRIRSNGKFGGLQNRAPLLEKMNGVVFSSPPPANYQEICTQAELLSNLEAALSRQDEARIELQGQIEECQSRKMHSDYAECLEADKQLQKIETQLGLTTKSRHLPPSLSEFLKLRTASNAATSQRRSINKRPSGPEENNIDHSPPKRGRTASDNQATTRRTSNSHDDKGNKRRKR